MATMAVALDRNLFLAYYSSFLILFNTFGERKIRYMTSEAAALKVSKRNFITRCYFNPPGHRIDDTRLISYNAHTLL